jgi:hypothetical protein
VKECGYDAKIVRDEFDPEFAVKGLVIDQLRTCVLCCSVVRWLVCASSVPMLTFLSLSLSLSVSVCLSVCLFFFSC